MGIITYLFIIEPDFVLWPLPGSFLRDRKWPLFPLELYSLGNMVQLGRFNSSLPPSVFLNLTPFCSHFLGVPRGLAVTKSILSPSGTTVSTGVFTPAVYRSVTMHGHRRKSLSQLCCGLDIQLRVIGWTLFGMTTGRSCFTCLQGLYGLFWIQLFVLLHT